MGMTEEDICLGDQLQIGTCMVEVSQSRQPCWKLNQRFDMKDMSLQLQKTGKTGWYYRVLQEGTIQAGDSIKLFKRPFPQWNLIRVNALMFSSQVDKEQHEEFAQLPLTPSWAKLIECRLLTGKIEDMHQRLYKG